MCSPLLSESDKSFWHGYTEFYSEKLPRTVGRPIVEFGVLHGNSIRWLLEKYPDEQIYGVDILQIQPGWPISERVDYRCVDQSNERSVENFFRSIPSPGLIIEDGSHVPSHQARCLRFGLECLAPGGFYILEDLHTSHPQHELYLEEFGGKPGNSKYHPTVLSLLLCFEHLLRIGRRMSEQQLQQFSVPGFMSGAQLDLMFSKIKRIDFYKRAKLPSRCYACNSTSFNYTDFTCACGVDLMKVADSMTAFIEVN